MTSLSGSDESEGPRAVAGALTLNALSWSAAASLASGLGALGFLTVGRFAVGLAEFAPMAHVWTVWSISAATVGFGAQIETVEGLSRGRGALSIRHFRMAALGAGLAGILTLAWREPLFGSSSLFWPAICGLIPLGSLITGVARGSLAADDERRRLAFVIAGENAVRFVAAALLWWFGARSAHLAWALIAGFGVALIGLSRLTVARRSAAETHASSGGPGAVAGLVAHACLVLPPSALALRGEAPEIVAAVFLVLTYVRAPYQFLLGMGPVLTAQSFASRPDDRSSWFSDGRRTIHVGVPSMLGAGAIGLLGGDLMSSLVLGRADIVTPLDYAILCALVVAVALSILRTLRVLADGGRSLVLRAWGTTAVVAIGAAFAPGSPTLLFAFLLGGVFLCLLQLAGPDFRLRRQRLFRGDDQL